MARTEIRYFAGSKDNNHRIIHGEQIIEPEIFEGQNAISEGYARFKEIIKDERTEWLLHASVRRDFEDNMSVDITLRIGPEPYWSEEYLKSHGLGKYAYACAVAKK